MGNPSVELPPINERVSPPLAPPAQPGEVRSCANCARLVEMVRVPGGLDALCGWRGPWAWPHKGCDHWAQDPMPRVSLLPGMEPKPLQWVGKGGGTKRRQRW